MQRVKDRRRDLPGHIYVPQIGARVVATGIAAAPRIERAVVFGKPRVLDIDAALAGEELPVSRIPRRHDAIEHVDTSSNAFDQVLRRSGAHEVAGMVHRQACRRPLSHFVHDVRRLADTEAANGVTLEPERDGGICTRVAEIRKYAALDDPEL